MPHSADAIYRAWRPRDFIARVVVLFAGTLTLVTVVVGRVVDAAVESGAGAILGLLVAVVFVFSIPAVVGVTTATTLVRVKLDRDGVRLIPVSRSALRPDLDVVIPLRGLAASWHYDDASTNLVLRPAGDTAIALTNSERGVLDGLAKALAARGVTFD